MQNYFNEKYCGRCGKQSAIQNNLKQQYHLKEQPSSAETERRQVTVLFSDVVGYTKMFNYLDPEDMSVFIRAYQGIVLNIINEFGGYTARIFGDGVMAYFGFPLALEDAARRAIYAALLIRDRATSKLSFDYKSQEKVKLRIGIATGMVVAGDIIGQGAAQQFSLVGEAPNLASRIQNLARPNSVVIAENTRKLLGRYFTLKEMGEYQIDGFIEPIGLYEVTKTKARISRFDANRQKSLSPFVGRDKEINLIDRQFTKHHQNKKTTMIAIKGEAGIGKSRLLRECLYFNTEHSGYMKLNYQCSQLQQNNTLYPVLEQLRQISSRYNTGLLDNKTKEQLKIGKRSFWKNKIIRQWFAQDEEADNPYARSEELQILLIKELEYFCRYYKTVVIFEDIHWADPGTLDLISKLLMQPDDSGLLMFATYRNHFDPLWPKINNIKAIHLHHLTHSGTRKLISNLQGAHNIPASLINQIVSKTAGNPFFTEELTRSILSSIAVAQQNNDLNSDAAKQIYIPSTLHDLLMSRLDRLAQAKEIVQIASVIGQVFSDDLLAELTGRNRVELNLMIEKITDRDVFEQSGDEGQYLFCHALLQEAAYESLLKSKRRFYHSKFARILVDNIREDETIKADLIAHHYTLAKEFSSAVKYTLIACDRALNRNANRELINLASRGLDLVKNLNEIDRDEVETIFQIYHGVGYHAVKGLSCLEAEKAFLQAKTLSEKNRDTPRLLDALLGLHTCYHIRGDLEGAGKINDIVEQVSTIPSQSSNQFSNFTRATNEFWSGNFTKASDFFQDALAIEPTSLKGTSIFARIIKLKPMILGNLSWILWFQGKASLAVETADNAMALVDEFDQPMALGACLFWVAVTQVYCGNYKRARQILSQSSRLSKQYDLTYLNVIMRVVEGTSLLNQGKTQKGFEHIDRAVLLLTKLKAGIGLPWALTLAAEALLKQKRINDSKDLLDRAYKRTMVHNEFHWLAEIHRIKGQHKLIQNNIEQAKYYFEKASRIANNQGAFALELRASIDLAMLYRENHPEKKNRQEDTAMSLLQTSINKLNHDHLTPDLIKAQKIVARID